MTLGEELAGQDGEFHIHVPLPFGKIPNEQREFDFLQSCIFFRRSPDAHQRTVYFAGSAQEVKQCQIEYSLVNTMHYVSPDPDKVSPEQPDFDTGELLPHIAFTPYLRALTREIVGNETNPLKKARKIYDFVTTKVVYSYMRSYVSLPVIPEYCASRLRGDCGVQALTFITMCRIAGIPARWQSGLYADWRSADSPRLGDVLCGALRLDVLRLLLWRALHGGKRLTIAGIFTSATWTPTGSASPTNSRRISSRPCPIFVPIPTTISGARLKKSTAPWIAVYGTAAPRRWNV